MTEVLEQPSSCENPERPPIVVRRSEYSRLYAMAMGAMFWDPRGAGALLDELKRCRRLDDAEVDDEVVGLRSTVVFNDASRGPDHRAEVRIVPPSQAARAEGRVSALSDEGAALLGLSPGQSILWNDRRGRTTTLTVLEVRKDEEVLAS